MTKQSRFTAANLLNRFFSISISSLLLFCSAACSQDPSHNHAQNNLNQTIEKSSLDDRSALAAQAEHAIKRQITVVARVKKLLPEDVQGLPHQRFLIELSNGSTVLIAHDLKMAPSVPIKPGDVLCIRGEYIWNRLGGLIHWTHHTDTPRHENGWIEFNGVRYQ